MFELISSPSQTTHEELLLLETDKLKYAVPLRMSITSRGTTGQYKNLAHKISLLYDSLKLKSKRIDSANKERTLENIILSLLEAERHVQLVYYSRRRGHYTLDERYGFGHFSYRKYVPLLDSLHKDGYIHYYPGYFNPITPGKKGRRSRVCGTNKLFEYFHEYMIQPPIRLNAPVFHINGIPYFTCKDLVRYKNEQSQEPVILKDKNKRYISYQDTTQTMHMRDRLIRYNEFISSADIVLPEICFVTGSQIDNPSELIGSQFIRDEIHHIRYKEGNLVVSPAKLNYGSHVIDGLAMSAIQNTRPRSWFNSELAILSTLDSRILRGSLASLLSITGNNFTKLYLCRPLESSLFRIFNESFEFGGRFYRADYQRLSETTRSQLLINGSPVKEIDIKAVQASLLLAKEGINPTFDAYDIYNGDTLLRECVKQVFLFILNCKNHFQGRACFENWCNEEGNHEYMNQLQNKGLDYTKIKNAVLHKYPFLRKYLKKEYGRVLQKMDSDIAMNIIEYFMNKGIHCLCIHDSFIVPKDNEDELNQVIKQKFKDFTGFGCITDYCEPEKIIHISDDIEANDDKKCISDERYVGCLDRRETVGLEDWFFGNPKELKS